MNDSDIRRRLTRLEYQYGVGVEIEIEDMRFVEIHIYGADALEEITQSEGLDSLKEIADNPEFSEEEKAMIAEFIRQHDHK